jgi:phosphoserine phosphatase
LSLSRARFPVVFFDLDGTLLRGTTVSLMTAEWLGRRGALDELERRYADGAISNSAVAEASAPWFAGHAPEEVAGVLDGGPWIDGIAETVAALHASGTYVALATVTWRFAAETAAARFGFDEWCGTELATADGRLLGTVSRICEAHDKATFAEEVCARRGVDVADAAAIGDSRSDLPMFERVGFSIALNADAAARAAATTALDTDDLRDALPLLLVDG